MPDTNPLDTLHIFTLNSLETYHSCSTILLRMVSDFYWHIQNTGQRPWKVEVVRIINKIFSRDRIAWVDSCEVVMQMRTGDRSPET